MICARCTRHLPRNWRFQASQRQQDASPSRPLPTSRQLLYSQCPPQLSSPQLTNTFTTRTLTTTSTPRAKGLEGKDPPAATSTSAAQPFSTPTTPTPFKTDLPTTGKDKKAAESAVPTRPASSVPAGTPFKGLAYILNADPPVAKEDSEYPSWLWDLIDQPKREITFRDALSPGPGSGTKPKGKKPSTSANIPTTAAAVGGAAAAAEGERHHGAGALQSKRSRQRALDKALQAAAAEQAEASVPLYEQSIDLPAGMSPDEGRQARQAQEQLRMEMREARRKGIREGNFLKGMS